MASTIFNVLLFAAVLYFYSTNNLFAAAACALFLVYRIFQNRLTRVASVVSRLNDVPSELGCLTCRFSVEHALSHLSVDGLFQRLRSGGKVEATDAADWRRLLVENYKRKYRREAPFEEIRFNVKNNLLFRNGEVDFGDTIYHAVEIPYKLADDGTETERSFLTPRIEAQLEIRVLIVNGILLLQLGDFDKTSSPQILRDGSLAVYQTYVTLTSFPLMYFGYRLGLPTRYLNLSSHATDSYKNHWRQQDKKQHSFCKKKPGMFDDWRRLHQELAAYRALFDEYDTSNGFSNWKKLSDDFDQKRDKLLAANGFKTWNKKHDDDWRFPDTGDEYSNDYLYVLFQNLNLRREYASAHWYTDFYEELP